MLSWIMTVCRIFQIACRFWDSSAAISHQIHIRFPLAMRNNIMGMSCCAQAVYMKYFKHFYQLLNEINCCKTIKFSLSHVLIGFVERAFSKSTWRITLLNLAWQKITPLQSQIFSIYLNFPLSQKPEEIFRPLQGNCILKFWFWGHMIAKKRIFFHFFRNHIVNL